jgi:hypothetical protein
LLIVLLIVFLLTGFNTQVTSPCASIYRSSLPPWLSSRKNNQTILSFLASPGPRCLIASRLEEHSSVFPPSALHCKISVSILAWYVRRCCLDFSDHHPLTSSLAAALRVALVRGLQQCTCVDSPKIEKCTQVKPLVHITQFPSPLPRSSYCNPIS